MPSPCPRCRRPIEEGAICCADVRYMWRCRRCFQLTTAFVVPFNKCSQCGNELQMITDFDLPEAARVRAVRNAVQVELDLACFYRLAREQARHWEQRAVLDRLFEAKVQQLSEIESRFHAHFDHGLLELSLEEQNQLSQHLFRGICLSETSGVTDLYAAALEAERRAGNDLRKQEGRLPAGTEQRLYADLAAVADRDMSVIEAELGLLGQPLAAP